MRTGALRRPSPRKSWPRNADLPREYWEERSRELDAQYGPVTGEDDDLPWDPPPAPGPKTIEEKAREMAKIGRWMSDFVKANPTATADEIAHEASRTFHVPCTPQLKSQAAICIDPFMDLCP